MKRALAVVPLVLALSSCGLGSGATECAVPPPERLLLQSIAAVDRDGTVRIDEAEVDYQSPNLTLRYRTAEGEFEAVFRVEESSVGACNDDIH